MNKKPFLLIFIILIIFLNKSKAADVEIQVIGAILGQSCNVTSSSLIKNINFSDIDPKIFNTVGAYSDYQKFYIYLKDCTGSVNNLSYKISGDADDKDPTLFKIKGDGGESGLATGLGIEVLDNSFKVIPVNTKTKLNLNITTSTYNVPFNVRYKSTDLNVTPGNASSILYLDIYYD